MSTTAPTRFVLDTEKMTADLAEFLTAALAGGEIPSRLSDLDDYLDVYEAINADEPLAGPWTAIDYNAESASSMSDMLYVAWGLGWLTGPADYRPDVEEEDWHISFTWRLPGDGPLGGPRLSTLSEEWRKVVDRDDEGDAFAPGIAGLTSFYEHVVSYCNAELYVFDALVEARITARFGKVLGDAAAWVEDRADINAREERGEHIGDDYATSDDVAANLVRDLDALALPPAE